MIELQALNYVIQKKDASFFLMNSLNEDFFTSYKAEYKFINDHIKKYNVVPDSLTVQNKFPDFPIVETTEAPEYIVNQLYQEYNAQMVVESYKKSVEKFKKKDFEGGIAEASGIAKKVISNSPVKSVDLISDRTRYDAYIEKTKDLGAYYVTTGFPEIDNLLGGGWDRKEELATIIARPGVGKCLQKGTKVLMADGTVKAVEDICVGDRVQSLLRANTVLALHNGGSTGYKIVSTDVNDDSFIVSKNHILTLYDSSLKMLVDIMIEDYLNLSEDDKSKYFLYYAGVEYPEKSHIIPPYQMGKQLKDLVKNEIPSEYIVDSSMQRKYFMAGVIDSYGCYDTNTSGFKLNCKDFSRDVIEQLMQIARGICVGVRYEDNYIYFIDNASIIPTIHRTKFVTHILAKPVIKQFSVVPIERVEYYGFRCDGDERYLLWNNIITHNTWILLKCATAAAQKGLRVGLYSGEMSDIKVGYRVDTLLGNISNSDITHGNIAVQNVYKEYLDKLSETVKGSILVLTPEANNRKLATVSDLQAFIEREHLDMLCIDQHSLLEDERHGRDNVTKASNISKDLKTLQVLSKIPIISVSQQNRDGDKDENADLDVSRIAQTDRIGQDSTICLILQHDHHNDILTVTMAKVRDAQTGKKLRYIIDLNRGIFTYAPSECDATGGSGCDKLMEEYDGYEVLTENTDKEISGEDIF